jgi:adenosylcobinamide-phosphate synthase
MISAGAAHLVSVFGAAADGFRLAQVFHQAVFFFPGALLCGFGFDLLVGDPERLPHPVRLMGKLISAGERALRGRDPAAASVGGEFGTECGSEGRTEGGEFAAGAALVLLTVAAAFCVSAAILWLCFLAHPALAFAVSAIMSWQCVSVRSLAVEANKVLGFLRRGDLAGARGALSMIVGRDTGALDEEGVSKAAMETVAENTADGVVAPLFFLALGGPCLGMAYKAVNTLDSMVGYKNERYLCFGRAAARLDDAAGWLPARVAAILMIAAAALLRQDGQGALRVWRRDRRKHASPNSAQCESVLAGALGVALAGDAAYFGEVVRKPIIGDAARPARPADIKTATRMLYGTAFLFLPLAFWASAGVSALVLHAMGIAAR